MNLAACGTGRVRRMAWCWALALAVLALAVKSGHLASIDRSIAQAIGSIRSPGLDRAARTITFFGSSSCAVALLAATGLWSAKRHQGRPFASFLIAGCCGLGLQMLLRFWVAQWRPDSAAAQDPGDWAARYDLSGFTSGHGLRSALLYGWWGRTLLWMGTRRGALAASGCVLLILSVGLTRVYLGRHWPSDVLGAWLLALLVLAATPPAHQRS